VRHSHGGGQYAAPQISQAPARAELPRSQRLHVQVHMGVGRRRWYTRILILGIKIFTFEVPIMNR